MTMQVARAKLREICTNCNTQVTNKRYRNTTFQARRLDTIQSMAARYNMHLTSELISRGLCVVMEDAIDGKMWEWSEYIAPVVQSRATAGGSKFQCIFDPQEVAEKLHKKRITTERLYIHKEKCMLKLIGSTKQDRFFRTNASIRDVAQSQDLFIDTMVKDMEAMAMAIDGTDILGNWTGDNRQNPVLQINPYAAAYPHYDGFVKQSLLQAGALYYPTIDITLPAGGTNGAYFIQHHGSFFKATSITALVSLINGICLDVSDRFLYSASDIGNNKIRVVSNIPTRFPYGRDALAITYSESGEFARCGEVLPYEIIENAMPYEETPILQDFIPLTKENIYMELTEAIRQWKIKQILLHKGGIPMNEEQPYIGIDPLVFNDFNWAKLHELCEKYNADLYMQEANRLLPRFEPLRALAGTGIYYITTPSNIVHLTNLEEEALSNIQMWYDENCDKVKMRNDVLANVLVLDYSKFLTNACDSHFGKKLNAPFQPENLSHYCEDVRKDCCGEHPNGTDNFRAAALVECVKPDGVETTDYTLRLTNISQIPSNDGIDVVEWKVLLVDGNEILPSTQAESVEITGITQAQWDMIAFIQLTITLDSGEEDIVVVPKSQCVETF